MSIEHVFQLLVDLHCLLDRERDLTLGNGARILDLVEEIEMAAVDADESGQIYSSSLMYTLTLNLLNTTCVRMYNQVRFSDAVFTPLLLNLVSARKYFLFPGKVDM